LTVRVSDELGLVDAHDVPSSGEDLDFAVGDIPRPLGAQSTPIALLHP
jgi:hypothetical protein